MKQIAVLGLLFASLTGPALAAAPAGDGPAVDGPIATAPQTGAVPTTAADPTVQQIEAWVHHADDPLAPAAAADDGRVHGSVSVAAGTDGYRAASVQAQGKVGNADVAIAIDARQNDRRRWR